MVRYTSRPVGGRECALCALYTVRHALGVRPDCLAGDNFTFNIWQSYSLIRQSAHGQDGARFTRNEKYSHAQNAGGERNRIPTLCREFWLECRAERGPEREQDCGGGGGIGGGTADGCGAGAAGRGSAGVRADRDAGAGGADVDCDEPDAPAAGTRGGRKYC